MASAVLESPRQQSTPEANADGHYEIVDGQRIEVAPMSICNARVTNRLNFVLLKYAEIHRSGELVVEGRFRLPLVDRERSREPDIAYVTSEQWPLDRPMPTDQAEWALAPALAIEVVSPNDVFDDLMEKIDEYFEAGVRRVWVVIPNRRRVLVYNSPTAIRALSDGENLTDDEILPGFQVPVAEIFPSRP